MLVGNGTKLTKKPIYGNMVSDSYGHKQEWVRSLDYLKGCSQLETG